jgi:hypothetical protein
MLGNTHWGYGPHAFALLRRLQLTFQPFQGDGFEGIGALAIEALKDARAFATRLKGHHHRRPAMRATPGLVELSHLHNLKSGPAGVHAVLRSRGGIIFYRTRRTRWMRSALASTLGPLAKITHDRGYAWRHGPESRDGSVTDSAPASAFPNACLCDRD